MLSSISLLTGLHAYFNRKFDIICQECLRKIVFAWRLKRLCLEILQC